jgi:phenylpyruvate tautomerase PptA (4-oxalocrotonate tautomerase family)
LVIKHLYPFNYTFLLTIFILEAHTRLGHTGSFKLYNTTNSEKQIIMPFYEVHHSYPLNDEQRESLARAITDLHCAAFTTPSFFVHVRFIAHDINEGTYFMAGKRRTVNSNRITGVVRISSARSKSDFDSLASKMEDAWYNVVAGPAADGSNRLESVADKQKHLIMVMFTPMVTIREGGMVIPEAGQEGGWLKEQMPYFQRMSDLGHDDFTGMLKEIGERDDLKSLIQ